MALPSSPRSASVPAPVADDRRQRILDAAHRVCRAEGLASARMDAIAVEARVSKGTLYNHFASKEALLLAMVVERFRSGEAIVDAALGEPRCAAEALDRLVEGLVGILDRQAADYPLVFEAWSVVAHAPEHREPFYAALRALFRSWTDATRELVEGGQREGAFDAAVDAGAVARAMTGLLCGFLFRATFDPQHADTSSLRDALHVLLDDRLRPPTRAPERGSR